MKNLLKNLDTFKKNLGKIQEEINAEVNKKYEGVEKTAAVKAKMAKEAVELLTKYMNKYLKK